MAYVWFRRVIGLRGVSNVLSRMKDAESKCVQEIAAGQEAHDGTDGEACAVLQESRHGLKLRDLFVAVATVLFQQGEDVLMFPTRMGLVESLQLSVHLAPSLDFFRRIVYMRNRLTRAVALCHSCNLCSSGTVDWVLGTRMVRTFMSFILLLHTRIKTVLLT